MKKSILLFWSILFLNSGAFSEDSPPTTTGTITLRNNTGSEAQFDLVLTQCPSPCPQQTYSTSCLDNNKEESFPASTLPWKLIAKSTPDQGLQFTVNSKACGKTPPLASPYSGQFRYNPYYQNYTLFCKPSGLGPYEPPVSCVFQ